jgi:hypothetical protein
LKARALIQAELVLLRQLSRGEQSFEQAADQLSSSKKSSSVALAASASVGQSSK